MRQRQLQPLQATLIALGLLVAGIGTAQQFGTSVRVREAVERDFYGAGRQVLLEAPIAGDAVVAGQRVEVRAKIAGDLIAAGETVEIAAPVGDDVRAAGRLVRIGAAVSDHLVAAGESVLVEDNVGGFAWLAGADVRVEAAVGEELKVVAAEAFLNGRVGGNVEVTAESIELGPAAEITGDLIWRSEQEPVISPTARVGGRIIAKPVPRAPPVTAVGIILALLLTALGIILTGLVLFLLFPHAAGRTAEVIRAAPGKSLGLGFAVLAATPFAVLLLFVSTLGILLGLILLALYLAALPLGWFAGAYCTGEYGLGLLGRREGAGRGRRLGAFVAAMILLGLLQLIPLLGLLVAVAVAAFGLGGMVLAAARGCERTVS